MWSKLPDPLLLRGSMTQLKLWSLLWDQAEVHVQLSPQAFQLLLLPHPVSLTSHLPRALPQQATCARILISGSVPGRVQIKALKIRLVNMIIFLVGWELQTNMVMVYFV